MNTYIVDTIMDYLRLVSYSVVILTSLRGIVRRKFTNLLFLGDIFVASVLMFVVVLIHLFEVIPSTTLVDDYFLTTGAVVWALIHFRAILKDDKNGRKGNHAS